MTLKNPPIRPEVPLCDGITLAPPSCWPTGCWCCTTGERPTQARRVASLAHSNALIPGFSSPRHRISIRSGSTVRLSSAAGWSANLN